MDIAKKQKNIYDINYQTSLNYLNIVLASVVAIWIGIFIQTNISMQYKLI